MTKLCWMLSGLLRDYQRPIGRERHPGRMNLFKRVLSCLAFAKMQLGGTSLQVLGLPIESYRILQEGWMLGGTP